MLDFILFSSTAIAAVVDFRKSPYKKIINDGLTTSLNILNSNTISEVICYGLGSFSRYTSSKHQLAFLLTIKNQYECTVLTYDPVFSNTEIEVLKSLEIDLIGTNEEGKHIINRNKTTLVFMPHCPSRLLNNFLYYNWGTKLKNCIFLCNSWSQVVEQNSLEILKNTVNYILRLRKYVVEIELKNTFEFMETFSGTSIHILSGLDEAPLNFWHENEEPVYPNIHNAIVPCMSSST